MKNGAYNVEIEP